MAQKTERELQEMEAIDRATIVIDTKYKFLKRRAKNALIEPLKERIKNLQPGEDFFIDLKELAESVEQSG